MHRPFHRCARSGMTLIEVTIAMGVLTVAVFLFTGVVASSSRIGSEKRQQSVAAHAARSILERLRGAAFASVWTSYNAQPLDDPLGAGSAAGANFAVPGLDPRPDDPDGFVGRISLPEQLGALREDADDPELGLPRDLDGDTLVDDEDHRGDYRILPVKVEIAWQSPLGPRRIEMFTMLAPTED
ncbi:MAG: hypothetical protein FJ298_09120 [Planctomycetes bacterium]|nr:hypothetical protein [Planctomycetota bacterium]